MKCDLLIGRALDNGDIYILADDVMEAIAELKAEVNNLLIQNQELCQALQVMYSVEEYTELKAENRRLERALWIARAESAKNAAMFWWEVWENEVSGSKDVYDIDYCVITDKLMRTPYGWYDVFRLVERKCRAKAELYK